MQNKKEILKCCICYDETDQDSITDCNHIVCKDCVNNICTTKCPVCRREPFKNKHVTDEMLEKIKMKYENQVNELINDFPYRDNIQHNMFHGIEYHYSELYHSMIRDFPDIIIYDNPISYVRLDEINTDIINQAVSYPYVGGPILYQFHRMDEYEIEEEIDYFNTFAYFFEEDCLEDDLDDETRNILENFYSVSYEIIMKESNKLKQFGNKINHKKDPKQKSAERKLRKITKPLYQKKIKRDRRSNHCINQRNGCR